MEKIINPDKNKNRKSFYERSRTRAFVSQYVRLFPEPYLMHNNPKKGIVLIRVDKEKGICEKIPAVIKSERSLMHKKELAPIIYKYFIQSGIDHNFRIITKEEYLKAEEKWKSTLNTSMT